MIMQASTDGHGQSGRDDQVLLPLIDRNNGPPDGASGMDLAVYYTLLDSVTAGEDGLRVCGTAPFGRDDGTGENVKPLKINSSVVYSLLLHKELT